MKSSLLLPFVLLALAGPALADNPGFDLPRQGDDPVQPPVQDSISGNIGEIPEVADLSPGDRAPDFKLRDSTGKDVRLSDLRGHLSALIFESDCKLLGPFAAVNDSLQALGVRQYGISENSDRAIEAYASRERLDFPLLSDPNASVSRRFGMYDTDNQAIQAGLILLDEKGVILMVVQGSGLQPDAVPILVRHAIAAHIAESAG